MNDGNILIGIDGGGTHSRALCSDLLGRVLAYVEGDGTSPTHDDNAVACQNMQTLITRVITDAGRQPGDVTCLMAGLAGLDRPADETWAAQYTALPGIHCPRVHLNDSIVAHAGALRLQPGILSVAGTGTITTGITENGEIVRNYDFSHYSRSSARHVAGALVHHFVAYGAVAEDQDLLGLVLQHWQVDGLAELAAHLSDRSEGDHKVVIRKYGTLAPRVTAAASADSPTARLACDAVIDEIVTAIRLVASRFSIDDVPVALTGGVISAPYIRTGIIARLEATAGRRCTIVDAVLPPAGGAILLAMRELGIPITGDIVDNLRECPSHKGPGE